MNVVLFDYNSLCLFPLTLGRAVADIRVGIFTIRERWERLTGKKINILTQPYLQPLYGNKVTGDSLFINAATFPERTLVEAILNLDVHECILENGHLVAGRTFADSRFDPKSFHQIFTKHHSVTLNYPSIVHPHNIFQLNDNYLRFDFCLINTKSVISSYNRVNYIAEDKVFIEEGASLNYCTLNAEAGPIYIGKNATVMEGSCIRGPFALGEGATVKMAARIYGATSVGPFSVVSGEIKNSVIFGYSNKGHDGYMGDSVIAEWCNWGAGTSNSNVKNTGGEVKMWDYNTSTFLSVGNKCGVIMGDHSRTAINTSINTGTSIGVCTNIFGNGLTPKQIKSFSWGLEGERYHFDKAMVDIANWKKMKNKQLSEAEVQVLRHIFENY